MGDYSIEFCGGTHVANTSEIGAFKILSESGVAAGVRRIEALTSKGLMDYYGELEQLLHEAPGLLKQLRILYLRRLHIFRLRTKNFTVK